KSDSVISEKIGRLVVTLSSGKTESGEIAIRNKMNVSFNGIIFAADDESPVELVNTASSRERIPLSLLAFAKLDPLTCEFLFSENVVLTFSVSDDTNKALLSIRARLPSSAQSLYLPYELYNSTFVTAQGTNYLQLDVRNSDWELSCAGIDNKQLAFTQQLSSASYSHFDRTKTFTFESSVRYAGADNITYTNTVNSISQNLINTFIAYAQSDRNISEQDATSFVAAMAEQGRYNDALDIVPFSFKRGVNRTYISAPYFDNLAIMNRTLEQEMNSFNDIINQGTLASFSVPRIEDYMCMHPGSGAIRSFLSNAANLDEKNLSLMQASGIIRVYEKLLSNNEELASLLSPAVDKSLNKIAQSIIAEENAITISEGGTFVSVIQASEIASALLKYGNAIGNDALVNTGYLIISSYLAENASFDLATLSSVYPFVAYENKFYPHFALLGFDRGMAVYAWTCATNMSFEKDASGASIITIDFPETYTHYVIINGIQAFRTIYIYEMAFRTDPRFETYNSSGYVFNANTNTMLLKSRHKSRIERVRLIHSQNTQVQNSSSQGGRSETSLPSASASSSSTAQEGTTRQENSSEQGTE
ncbi:MAG: hypothetical protein IJR49_00915, partial [Treponema sp.]|nr:hypothetical protein [Treponema sp.]